MHPFDTSAELCICASCNAYVTSRYITYDILIALSVEFTLQFINMICSDIDLLKCEDQYQQERAFTVTFAEVNYHFMLKQCTSASQYRSTTMILDIVVPLTCNARSQCLNIQFCQLPYLATERVCT